MMDSTAYLVGSNAAYVELAFQRLPTGQPDVQENNPFSRHRKSETSLVLSLLGFLASSNTGAMPACDMSASSVMRAPETGLAAVSANLRMIVAGPTCGGSGEIKCSTVTDGDESIGLEHPVTYKGTTQKSAKILRQI
jgi:hypothetical protein